MQLPLSVTRVGSRRLSENGLTRNISSGGVLFTSEHLLDIGGPIEYVITLSGKRDQTVTLRCMGKVLRYGRMPESAGKPFEVAVTLERYEFRRSHR